jgi:dihydrofolate reductase
MRSAPRCGRHEKDHHERKDEPMKLTTNTQVSVDGVMQANGGRHAILDPGMERGGWARPLFDSEAMTFVDEFYGRADAFLFGRRTYELFAGYWGVREDLENPIVRALNTRPKKYVASNTLTDPQWADTTVLSDDLAAAIGELKARPGGELQVHGSAHPDPVAARERPRRRDDSPRLPRGRRPGHAAVPRRRPGDGA